MPACDPAIALIAVMMVSAITKRSIRGRKPLVRSTFARRADAGKGALRGAALTQGADFGGWAIGIACPAFAASSQCQGGPSVVRVSMHQGLGNHGK